MTATRLASLTAQIGERQGELRAVHLKCHLTTAKLLSADQRQRYAELRGYRARSLSISFSPAAIASAFIAS